MSPRWQKIKRDLWSNRGRTILVVLAIAVGVISFGSVFASKELLLKSMSSQYLATHPASINLTISTGFSDDLVRWAETQPGIEAARGSVHQMVRLYTNQGSRNVQLVTINYQQNFVNQIIPQTGTWPPGRQELVFERKSAPLGGASLGSTVEVELPNGDKRTLTTVGTAHDYQAIPANMYPELTAYVNFATLTWLGFPDHYTQLDLVTDPSVTTKEEAKILAEQLKTKLEQKGFSPVGVQAEKPGKHWGEDPTNAFVTILTIVGSFSLALSVFLVINTITAVLARERKQIGIMKAVGATNPALIQLYLAMAGAYGLLALIVAVPLGALLSYINLAIVTNFLNLNISHFTIPPAVIFLEATAAVGVPLLAAIVPVVFGLKMSVREAISDIGVTAHTNPIIDRITKDFYLLSRPTLLSIRNTFRKKTRLILTLITLSIAGTLYMSVISVQDGMMTELESVLKLYNYDLELFFEQPYTSASAIKQALKTEGIVSAETPKYAYGYQLVNGEKSASGTEILGLNPSTEFMQPSMTAGRWINDTDRNQIVISSKFVRDDPSLQPGKEIEFSLYNQTYRFEIVGIFMEPSSQMGVINEKYLQRISPTSENISSVRVATAQHSGTYLAEIAKQLEQNMKKSGFDVAYTMTIDTIRSSNIGQFSFITNFLFLMAGMVAVVGGLSLTGTMSLNVLERTREIGVMRSIGAGNGSIRSLVIVESLIVGILSWLIALPLSVPLGLGFCYAVGNALFEKPLNYSFSISSAVVWLTIVTVIATFASLAPAHRASKLTIRETLSYE